MANPEQTPESFIKTPLEFFGHSAEDIFFDYPDEYYQELEAAKAEKAPVIQELQAERDKLERFTDAAEPDSHTALLKKSIDSKIHYDRYKSIRDVNHKWYERRFRGRYPSNIRQEDFPNVGLFYETASFREYNPESPTVVAAVPDGQEFAGYLNEAIRLNEWRHGYSAARLWYNALEDENPDKEVARNYVGFTGNIILHEYVRTAVALARDELAEEDSISVKHFITVCWPTADELQEFIPEEVKRTKQLLRETFLQMSARGGASIRFNVDRFGRYILKQPKPKDDEEWRKQREVSHYAMLGFEDSDSADKEQIRQDMLQRAENMVDEGLYDRAIDMLDLSRYSFGFDPDEFQEVIDEYAIEGTKHYTNDITKLHEPWPRQIGRRERWTTNDKELLGLLMAEGVSREAKNAMEEISQARTLEYSLHKLKDAEGVYKTSVLWKLFDQIDGMRDVSNAERLAGAQVKQELMELLTSPEAATRGDSGTDSLVESVVRLRNGGFFTFEQQNDILMSLIDNIFDKAETDPANAFDYFIGYISPILRLTRRADDPRDEDVWRVVSRNDFVTFMYNLAGGLVEDNARHGAKSAQVILKRKNEFLDDIRSAWEKYWDIRGEY